MRRLDSHEMHMRVRVLRARALRALWRKLARACVGFVLALVARLVASLKLAA